MARATLKAVLAEDAWTFTGPRRLLRRFPDFFILGPQRTGTTWLANNLREHPQVFVTRPKELYFFNFLDDPDHFRFSSKDLAWYLEHFYKVQNKDGRARQMLSQIRRFRFRQMRGEATASYAADISPAIMDAVVRVNPDLRAILMIRNPVQRAWSHMKKDLLNQSFMNERERQLSEVPAQEIESFLSHSYQLACGNFTQIIRRWQSRLADNNLFVGFFDEIQSRPEALLLDVFRFLGVEADRRHLTKLARLRIAATDKPDNPRPIPEEWRAYLERIHGEERQRLRRRFDRPLIG